MTKNYNIHKTQKLQNTSQLKHLRGTTYHKSVKDFTDK